MKNKRILRQLNRWLASLVGMLGVTSCGHTILLPGGGDDLVVVKYGCPTAEFNISGRVTNQQGEPLKEIEMRLTPCFASEVDGTDFITSQTDAKGNYVINTTAFPVDSVRLIALDVDGDINGSYQSDTVYLKTTFENGDGEWFNGSFKGTANFTLQEKNAGSQSAKRVNNEK